MLNISDSGKVSITIESSKLKADISIKQEQVDKYIKSCLHDSCQIIKQYAKEHHSFKNHSGNLERAIKFRVIDRLKEGIIYIDPKVAKTDSKYDSKPYGQFVTQGTGIWGEHHAWYPIYPRYKKAISYIDRKTGDYITRKMVWHPGSKASNFLQNAKKNTELEVKYIWEQGLKRLING